MKTDSWVSRGGALTCSKAALCWAEELLEADSTEWCSLTRDCRLSIEKYKGRGHAWKCSSSTLRARQVWCASQKGGEAHAASCIQELARSRGWQQSGPPKACAA